MAHLEPVTYRLDVRYEGTRYKGWQKLKQSDMTIQGKIEKVLSQLLEEPIEIQGSGRTDAGVHAMNQVASFSTAKKVRVEDLKNQMNQYLPDDIVILKVEVVPSGFHARFHATRKHYAYRLWTDATPPVFERHVVGIHSGESLDVAQMKKGVLKLLGKHDFKGFSSDKTKKSTVRTIERIDITKKEREIVFDFYGDGFLYNMIRILVGTLVEIGMHKRSVDSIDEIFITGRRELAGETAQPQGLMLMEVFYESIADRK